MTDVFAWVPLVGPSGTTTMRTRKAQFGDGYSQAVQDGINNASDAWPLAFIGGAAKITPIRDFLRTHGGASSFYWTPPLGTQGLYRCESYQLVPQGGDVYTLAATFQQVFAP